MKVKEPVTLFEYGYLGVNGEGEIHQISLSAYQYLKDMCLSDKEDRHLFQLRKKNGQEVLQVQSHAGVILTPDGTQIEILPKIGKSAPDNGEAYQKARNTLLIMLQALRGFKHIKTSSADIKEQKKPLLEVFIHQFLQSLNHLLKHGLRRDYVQQEDNLFFCKGKLKVKEQIQKNFVQKHRFYCEYDEFLLDRPANRLIKSALEIVSKQTNDAKNQRVSKRLQIMFSEVPESYHYQADFSALKKERGMSHYEVPLKWSKLILEGFSPLTMKGKNHAISLLFPMEKVFESYVAQRLRKQLKSGYSLKAQVQKEHLVSHRQERWFCLKPDLVIKKDEKVISVLDTKWKLLDSSKDNGTEKYGLSQSDFYQMSAYGNAYLQDAEGEIFLIYPAHEDFKKAVKHPFEFMTPNRKKLRLWVVPFGIEREKPQVFICQKIYSISAKPFT